MCNLVCFYFELCIGNCVNFDVREYWWKLNDGITGVNFSHFVQGDGIAGDARDRSRWNILRVG